MVRGCGCGCGWVMTAKGAGCCLGSARLRRREEEEEDEDMVGWPSESAVAEGPTWMNDGTHLLRLEHVALTNHKKHNKNTEGAWSCSK